MKKGHLTIDSKGHCNCRNAVTIKIFQFFKNYFTFTDIGFGRNVFTRFGGEKGNGKNLKI